ncbi:hypothetical protein ACFWWA_12170 [Streptomyces goshikiensis]|uniref:hypothetical protein n=1 Tax=Streptomyces goshikiensis TaxID=1942 RepID=UPI00365E61DF
MSMLLLRNLLVLAVEFGAAYLLRSPDPAPWIPVLLAVFVVGSGVLHGTDAEFVPRFLVAFVAVGVAWLGGAAAGEATDSVPAAGAVTLLVIQTALLIRFSRRP